MLFFILNLSIALRILFFPKEQYTVVNFMYDRDNF